MRQITERDRAMLAQMGIAVQGIVGSRLQGEVEARWAGRNDDYERGWAERGVVEAIDRREIEQERDRWRENFERLLWCAALGWCGLSVLGFIVLISRFAR